ncbi:hypothetical protein AaE_015247 [Aphanomyces astaci]|uniref:PiggyBac transposable element-derived protein domain-containing protein n=1 Tax=Aphanomyces astaci TaxID=112090 RepID=A0A6A4Z189_APHAT|nr:hypothetical protein AaE_015247 [Aphanomyces astaci]
MQGVAFRPVEEVEVHGNDAKLLKLYGQCGTFWLRGCIRNTTFKSVKVPVASVLGAKVRKARTEVKTVAISTINWVDTRFQHHEPKVCTATMLRGIQNYARIMAAAAFDKSRTFLKISAYKSEHDDMLLPDKKELNVEQERDEHQGEDSDDIDASSDEDEVLAEYVDRTWKKREDMVTRDIEGVESVKWEYGVQCGTPGDLFTHADGETPHDSIKVKPRFNELFVNPAKGFLGMLPLDFWRQVLAKSNANAHKQRQASTRGFVAGRPFNDEIRLDELMKFLGILVMMSVIRAGEYRLYWTNPDTNAFMMPAGRTIRSVMSLDRFKVIRAVLTFNDVAVEEDPLWRLRPLINLLKASFKLFVVAGREISVDEASIPCRSSHARALIVYNPMKPLGKYHFRIYTAACATSWYVHAFKIHSKASSKFDSPDDNNIGAVEGSDGEGDANEPNNDENQEEMKPSSLRQHVLDITKQWKGSKRVLNMDNWYSSVQLCMTLREIGLYCRGTVRSNRAHTPRFVLFRKNEVQLHPRGHSRVAYAPDHGILAVSWLDGSVVNFVSTADGSETTSVGRRIGRVRQEQPSLEVIKKYNKYMQGVDRHDQLRERFSIAKGASFKKWYRKLAFALVDIAISNVYVLWAKCDASKRRDAHMHFHRELAMQLMFEMDWDSLVDDAPVPFSSAPMPQDSQDGDDDDDDPPTPATAATSARCPQDAAGSERLPHATDLCDRGVDSKSLHSISGRRVCCVCMYERADKVVTTQTCLAHQVSLCTRTYPPHDSSMPPYLCPSVDWDCWDKYHHFYKPQNLFHRGGSLNKSSDLYKLKREMVGRVTQPRTPKSARNLIMQF